MILSIRTDKPEAEIGLFDGQKKVDYLEWPAHRELSATIHQKVDELLAKNKLQYQDLTGVAVYEGPGSFTGLRIGISVANALAFSLDIPITSARGNDWIQKSINKKDQKMVLPFYGEPARTTRPRK